MQPLTTLVAIAAPLGLSNVDTDKIIPARFLNRSRNVGYGDLAFHDIRFDTNGGEVPEFVLNQAPYRRAKIIVAGPNFGCGSSREAAVYALSDFGIRSVIAPSFGEIHYQNQIQNGMLPAIVQEDACQSILEQLRARPGVSLSIDLDSQTVTAPDGTKHRFEIAVAYKERLLKGLDDIDLVLQHEQAIESFERQYMAEFPWLRRIQVRAQARQSD